MLGHRKDWHERMEVGRSVAAQWRQVNYQIVSNQSAYILLGFILPNYRLSIILRIGWTSSVAGMRVY